MFTKCFIRDKNSTNSGVIGKKLQVRKNNSGYQLDMNFKLKNKIMLGISLTFLLCAFDYTKKTRQLYSGPREVLFGQN